MHRNRMSSLEISAVHLRLSYLTKAFSFFVFFFSFFGSGRPHIKHANFFSYFQYNEQNVIFVVQGKHVFGELHDDTHGKFSIKPCPYNETCHVLLQKHIPE